MKMKLVLVAISAAALAVSADCQAMARRAPVRAAMPRVQRVPQRAFSFGKAQEKRLSMPNVAGMRQNAEILTGYTKHRELDAKLRELSKDIQGCKKDLAWISLVSAKCMGGLFFIQTPLPMEAFALLLFPVGIFYQNMQEAKKAAKSVDEELAELVADQKRTLGIPDDIQ